MSDYSSGYAMGSLLSQRVCSLREIVRMTAIGSEHHSEEIVSNNYQEKDDRAAKKNGNGCSTSTTYEGRTQRESFKLPGNHGEPRSRKLGRKPHL